MSLLFKCDCCEATEEVSTSHTPPPRWSRVTLHVRAGGVAKNGFEKVLCFKCAAQYGITEIDIKEDEEDEVTKLANYLYAVVETLVDEAVDNQQQ